MVQLKMSLTDGFIPIVSKGDSINADDIVAKKEAPADHVINIAETLQVPLKHVKKYLKKVPGDTIKKDDIIAEKKNFFGKNQAQIISAVDGIVLRYERDTGNLVIQNTGNAQVLELISPVAGNIILCNNKEIVIATDNAVSGLDSSFGAQAEGELFILTQSFEENASNLLYFLDHRAVGKIVLTDSLSRELIIKGDGIGVNGFITKTITNDDILFIQSRNVALPILVIDDQMVANVQKKEGHKVRVDGKSKVIIYLS